MTQLTDASGVALALPRPPRRIVSLIPSITETLCHLGLADALVGVTAYCVEPREVVRGKTRIGGEKDPGGYARPLEWVAALKFLGGQGVGVESVHLALEGFVLRQGEIARAAQRGGCLRADAGRVKFRR